MAEQLGGLEKLVTLGVDFRAGGTDEERLE
jgi:hypothetical protein